MGYKVIRRLSVPSEKLFSETQYCLGDTNGKYAVVDKYKNPFYMGSKEDCKQYIEDISHDEEFSLSVIISEINDIITKVNHHSPTANHFYRLKMRLLNGQKLTKKMKENLGWIKKDLEDRAVKNALAFVDDQG